MWIDMYECMNKQSDVVLETSNDVAIQQEARLQRERDRAAAKQFDALTENMHHLVSTKTTPGNESSLSFDYIFIRRLLSLS
jgi:hypothetical protein